MLLDPDQVESLPGATVLDADDEEVGTVADVLVNSSDDRPAWVVVEIDGRTVPIPLDGADVTADEVRVRYSRDEIAGAPAIEPGESLAGDAEDEAYDHYGISDATMRDDNTGLVDQDDKASNDAAIITGPDDGADDAEMGHP